MRTQSTLLALLIAGAFIPAAVDASTVLSTIGPGIFSDLELNPKERAWDDFAQVDDISPVESGPTTLRPESLIDLDSPQVPLSFDFPGLERAARPTGFANVSEANFDVVLFRSGRQIYLYVGVDGGAGSSDIEVSATFWEHETDAGIPDQLRGALASQGASPEAAELVVVEIAEMLDRPYRWQALCFTIAERVQVLGIASVR